MIDNLEFCGTAGCLAGHVALADGYQLKTSVLEHPETHKVLHVDPSYNPGTVAGYAMRRLGLTDSEADRLFHGRNTMADLKELVDGFCAEPERTEESKQALRQALDRVLAADAVGLWKQNEWVVITDD